MANDTTITLTISGDVTLALLSEALGGLNDLATAVSQEFHLADATWVVNHLHAHITVAELLGESMQPETLAQVGVAIVTTADLVARGLEDAVPVATARAAHRLTDVVDGTIPLLILQSGNEIATVEAGGRRVVERKRRVAAYGRLTGVIQTVSVARGFHFRIAEELYGRSVAGRFGALVRDDLRELCGKRATVEGIITRDARTGWPLTMTEVDRVMAAPEDRPDAFRHASGALPFSPDSESSENLLRRLRDAG